MIARMKKLIYLIAGLVCLAIGIIGMLIPVMPMSPFVLLSAYFFARTSRRFDDWVHNHRIFGRHMRKVSDKITAFKNNLRGKMPEGSEKSLE